MCVGKAAVPAAKNIMDRMEAKVTSQRSKVEELQILTNNRMELFEIGIEQISLVLRASPALHSYVLNNGRIRKLFF